ncbi:hypothetical protein NLI96_g10177 [Meripilus lineatus]|uniref:Protein-S-isoprenylcysteine O-methyltransferase n=1 Tax=Meripilus lineatus TaxID=2056292 RepID=A0AAD5UWE5_9APHY|nr:hypothetical protein NLI96_g10177 [Physisporinus lineatus]
MSLLKVPFIAAITLWVHTSLSSPNPASEFNNKTVDENFPTVLFIAVQRGVVRLVAVIEIILILIHNSAFLRQTVLSWFPALDGAISRANNLQITTPFLVGWALVWVAVDLRKRCYRELGPFFTINMQTKSDQRLVTTGPYSIVRHPSYTAAEILYVGAFLANFCQGSLWTTYVRDSAWSAPMIAVWAMLYGIVPLGFFLRRMPIEDAMLREAWPHAWATWSIQTPYKMIPFVYW